MILNGLKTRKLIELISGKCHRGVLVSCHCQIEHTFSGPSIIFPDQHCGKADTQKTSLKFPIVRAPCGQLLISKPSFL